MKIIGGIVLAASGIAMLLGVVDFGLTEPAAIGLALLGLTLILESPNLN